MRLAVTHFPAILVAAAGSGRSVLAPRRAPVSIVRVVRVREKCVRARLRGGGILRSLKQVKRRQHGLTDTVDVAAGGPALRELWP